MNVDVAARVCFGNLRRDDIFIVKRLGAFGAVFQHGAHGGIGVDIRVFAL